MTRKHKIAQRIIATAPIMLEGMDELKGTSFYKQELKNMINNLSARLEDYCDIHYAKINQDQKSDYDMVRYQKIIETFLEIMDNDKHLGSFQLFLESYKEGSIEIIDDKASKLLERNGLNRTHEYKKVLFPDE